MGEATDRNSAAIALGDGGADIVVFEIGVVGFLFEIGWFVCDIFEVPWLQVSTAMLLSD